MSSSSSASPALRILAPDEPPAFEVVNPEGPSSAVLLCDHASNAVPRSLPELGRQHEALREHTGWDIGAARLSRRMSALLDAPLVLSGYSRLVIDCNRPLGSPTSIPEISCGVPIPGNAIDAAEAGARADACFWPYHHAITALLDARRERRKRTAILSIHSFTPAMPGQERPWHAAVLYGRDRRLAAPFLEALRREPGLCVGDNEPYRVTEGGDYGIPTHGEARGLPCVLLEIRQDGLISDEGVEVWAQRLAASYRAIEASGDLNALPPDAAAGG
ncbi:N-formylglutamate amidohydrolase [Sorangium sp. So ce381]|uniref:N-formylglutamate amidohydrolase n=1 Tax=Sorangium sp. So ce381 TaxID=3133307 RepID=UPI003F5CACDC